MYHHDLPKSMQVPPPKSICMPNSQDTVSSPHPFSPYSRSCICQVSSCFLVQFTIPVTSGPTPPVSSIWYGLMRQTKRKVNRVVGSPCVVSSLRHYVLPDKLSPSSQYSTHQYSSSVWSYVNHQTTVAQKLTTGICVLCICMLCALFQFVLRSHVKSCEQ